MLSSTVLAIAGAGYGLIGLLVIIVLVLLIIRLVSIAALTCPTRSQQRRPPTLDWG